jgi:hypothetical protein
LKVSIMRVVSIDYGGQVVVNELLSSNAAKKQFTSSVMVERSFRAPGINLSNLSTEMEEAEKKIRSVCWVIGLPGSQSTSYVDAAQVPKKRLLEAFVSYEGYYGNEASEGAVYSYCGIVIEIPAFGIK